MGLQSGRARQLFLKCNDILAGYVCENWMGLWHEATQQRPHKKNYWEARYAFLLLFTFCLSRSFWTLCFLVSFIAYEFFFVDTLLFILWFICDNHKLTNCFLNSGDGSHALYGHANHCHPEEVPSPYEDDKKFYWKQQATHLD